METNVLVRKKDDDQVVEPLDNGVLGSRSIGMLGSIAFLTNQVYGPGVLVLPVALLSAGWFSVAVFNVVVYLLSVLGALMLVEAISKIEGNANFEKRVEFSTLVLSYLPRGWANFSRLCYHITMTLFNVCAIVLCAQAMDNALVWMTGHSYALQFRPEFKIETFDCCGRNAINGLYSGEIYRVGISLGYLIISLATMPLGFLSIADSVWIQIVSFIFTTVTIGIFFIQFCSVWDDNKKEVRSNHLEAFEDGNYSLCVTATVVSYMYSMYIPTWVNEKIDEVPVKRSLWTVTTAAMCLYLIVGIAAAVAYPYLKDRNVMQYLYENDQSSAFIKVVILVFSLTAVLPGIPINAISIRYNLYVSRLCGRNWSFFWGSCAPFLISWLFSNREMAVGVCLWALVICGGFINFMLPPFLFYKAHVAASEGRRIALIKDTELMLGTPIVEYYYECAMSPRLAASTPPLWEDDDEEELEAKEDLAPNDKAYVFDGPAFMWCRAHYGKIPLLMNVTFVAMLLFALYYRLRYEAHVQ